jgi:hypothetical protein
MVVFPNPLSWGQMHWGKAFFCRPATDRYVTSTYLTFSEHPYYFWRKMALKQQWLFDMTAFSFFSSFFTDTSQQMKA